MKPLNIEQTASTPLVNFDPATNTLCIVGESYPENSFDFYAPVIEWLKGNLASLAKFTLDITVTYMNSSSTKCTFDIIDIMEDAFASGVKVAIIWRYDRENPRSYEMAEDFREEATFPFEIEVLAK